MLDLPSAFAADVGHNVEYNIRDLGTRSVTLFPAQAQVKRDIKDVPLKPGINEISIVGLSPTIDKHSVMVEGSGAATITGISVEYLPNREIFDEVYPDLDDDDDDDDFESEDGDQDDEEPSGEPQSQTLLGIKMKLIELQDERQRAREIVGNADNRIKILDVFSHSLDKREGVNISEMLEVYQKEHTKAFEERLVGVQHERQLTEAIVNTTKEHSRLTRLAEKARAKELKNKAKIQKVAKKKKEQHKRRLEERRNEKQRIRDERARCWPRYCYTVHIQLEVHSSYTPASSRRESTSSEFDLAQRPRSKTVEKEDISSCHLILSYVTNSAFWTPSYDMQLSTVNSMGTLCFDAGLHNTTSETWENCKITLSTSQASSSSLDESHPVLTPWRIKLGSRSSGHGSGDVLESNAERQRKALPRNKGSKPSQSLSRQGVFGIGRNALEDYQTQLMLLEQQNKKRSMMARQEHGNAPVVPHSLPSKPARSAMPANQIQESQQSIDQRQMRQQQQAQQQQQMQQQMLQQHGDLVDFDFEQFLHEPNQDAGTPEAQPSIEFQNSLVEETGFTTTFDLPGLKTLVPKFTVSKQRVARLQFTNVQFSHTIVAKYQPVAYLKAKLKNTSKLTLFPGPASLTLDGSFMGQTKIPQCSSGGRFTLGLGVDSSIKVIYPKPDVRRSTSGMFNKEDSSVYVRTVTVHNTRVTAERPVNLLVLDQIPVSEDDRLRIELSTPHGLAAEGPSQPAGAPGRELAEDKDWGKATASLKKYGGISWDVSLNAGKAVKLRLEYAVSMPSGDVANEC
ncbi:hypothetical protein NW768_009483 [Fusarium equiseti]|uniref:Mucoidy inhibitor-like protein n=1 Tax=Fusarium equiseti TaxID=61235 RepID=A0ABQ8R2M4_FUSEQ|nr:hypothetical protein NW768_009483 [Fusarium equiseti]